MSSVAEELEYWAISRGGRLIAVVKKNFPRENVCLWGEGEIRGWMFTHPYPGGVREFTALDKRRQGRVGKSKESFRVGGFQEIPRGIFPEGKGEVIRRSG